MDNAEYHRHPAVSKSHLDAIARSPLHYHARYLAKNRVVPETTAAMTLGSAFHALVLEPEVFSQEYVQAPAADRRTKAGKEAWDALEGTPLSAADWDAIHAMAVSVHSHPAARRLLAKDGVAEHSLFWMTGDTECKCRPDYLTTDGWIVDLKSTEDASPGGFAKSAWNFRYHVQAAWYLDGVRAAGLEAKGFVFVAVEKRPPHAVAVYLADADMIASGSREAERNLRRIAECHASGEWPGYSDLVQTLSLPKWAKEQSDV